MITRKDAIKCEINRLREARDAAAAKVWADYDKKVREAVSCMVIEGEPVGTSPKEKVIAAINSRIAHYETRRVEMERKDPDAKSVHYIDGWIDSLKFALNLVRES
jgi:hypothetical protein